MVRSKINPLLSLAQEFSHYLLWNIRLSHISHLITQKCLKNRSNMAGSWFCWFSLLQHWPRFATISLTFLQLDVEPATFVLQVDGSGGVCAYPALQGGRRGRRSPGDQNLGWSGKASTRVWGAPCQWAMVATETRVQSRYVKYIFIVRLL